MTSPGIDDATLESWERVVEDMEATGAAYRERGWEVCELHPGDVTPLPPDHDRFGLDVLVPGAEYETVSELADADGAAFDQFEVFRATSGGTVFLVVAVEDDARERVVLIPAHYELTSARQTLAGVRERGTFPIHVRPLSLDGVVTFEPADPGPLLPPQA